MRKYTAKEITEKFDVFLKGSKHFSGIAMNGCFNMNLDNFIIALGEYLENGNNVLDEYAELIYLSWDAENIYDGHLINDEVIELFDKALNKDNFWNIYCLFNSTTIEAIKDKIFQTEAIKEELKSKEYRRRQATIYTSNKNIRKIIFKRDGKYCRKCNSTKELTLDHIISVLRGGENELNNLQVLCRSCNSKKGARY